jgi:hypothetical protein
MSMTPMHVLYFVIAFCVISQAFLLNLQWRAYRITRHKSLVWLMTGNALGLAFYLGEAARYIFISSSVLRWSLYMWCLPVMVVSVIVGISGYAMLLRAFSEMAMRGR